jgi:hypothetical protein
MKLRLFASAAVGAAWLAFASTPANAEAPSAAQADDGSDLAGLPVVGDEELAQDRGGFSWQGVDINLGAEMRTYLNGALVLQTNISWTAAGATTTQFVSGALTAADAAQLQAGMLSGAGISMHVGDQSVYLANAGQTALIQAPNGAIQNILINRASNVDIRQQVDATLNLGNFGPFQQQTLATRVGDSLGVALNAATLGALTH